MKNLSVILSILTVVACSVVFVGCNTNQGTGNVQVSTQSAGKIAYVNIDTLQARYDFYQDILDELTEQEKKAQVSLQQRYQEFATQKDRYVKQAQAGLLSANKMKQKEAELQQMNLKLQEYEQTVRTGLASSQSEKNEMLLKRISDYLKEYNKEKGYSYIMQHGRVSTLLLVDESNNITDDVVKGLNAAYAKEKEGTTDETK